MSGVGIKSVISQQRQVEVIAVTKTGLGAPVLSGLCAKFCQVVDNGVGDYTIKANVNRPGAQPLIAAVLAHGPGVIHKVVANSDKLQVRIKCFEEDGTTPQEMDFDLIMLGSDAQTLLG